MRVCLYGLGAIGAAVARALMDTEGVSITGAIDIDPAKTGRDLRSALRMRGTSGVVVRQDAGEVLDKGAHDVVIHTTGSRLADVASQLDAVLGAGLPCVTSCEEMSFPEASDPERAGALDRRAREHGVALLGTGVNPGFAMDALVMALSGATRGVRHVAVERVLDPLRRRKAFQKKVGLGMAHEEAARAVAEGRLGHVGLRQSASLIGRGLGWSLTGFEESIRVLCEDEDPSSPIRKQRPDAPVAGLHQVLRGRNGSREVIVLEMVMAAGVEAPHDAVTIQGTPDLSLWIRGGIPGDEATVSCLINGARQVITPPRPGLLTVLDLPLRARRLGDGAERL
ncbi:MAG: NAD(P)H-dependent amine dehydrogenase family protein [Candidatus Polarisedimenticolia bacterium]